MDVVHANCCFYFAYCFYNIYRLSGYHMQSIKFSLGICVGPEPDSQLRGSKQELGLSHFDFKYLHRLLTSLLIRL